MNHKPLPHRLLKTGTLLLCYSFPLLCVNMGYNGGVRVILPLKELKAPPGCLQGQSEVPDCSTTDSVEHYSCFFTAKGNSLGGTHGCSVLTPVAGTRNYSIRHLPWLSLLASAAAPLLFWMSVRYFKAAGGILQSRAWSRSCTAASCRISICRARRRSSCI